MIKAQQVLTPSSRQDYECIICNDIVCDPQLCKNCESCMCAECIRQCLVNSAMCPYCQTPYESYVSRRFLNKLHSYLIPCVYAIKGCSQSPLPYTAYHSHVQVCSFKYRLGTIQEVDESDYFSGERLQSPVKSPHLSHYSGIILFKFKVIILGETAVGKTSFLKSCIQSNFDVNMVKTTVGLDLVTRDIPINDRMIATMQFWDTSGQEQYKSIASQYLRGADGLIFMFDLSNRQSFYKVAEWYDLFINKTGDPNITKLLLGGKSDKPTTAR